MNTVKELRDNNFKVRVTHRRFYSPRIDWVPRLIKGVPKDPFDWPKEKAILAPSKESPLYTRREAKGELLGLPYEKGGSTTVDITTPDGVDVTAIADCSVMDTYNRTIGRNIALGRALQLLTKGES